MESDDEELKRRAIEKTDILFSVFINNPINFDMLFDVLIRTSNYERQIIAEQYKIKYNKPIFEEIKTLIKKKMLVI